MTIQAIYPSGIDPKAYEQAQKQCVIEGNWLYNQSEIDVWFVIDGFTIKVPAGSRTLCTGWDQIRHSVAHMDQEEFYGCHAPVNRGGFKFVSVRKLYIYDNLVVYSPETARAPGGFYGSSERTLEEHIALINEMKLEEATIIAENLDFLPHCPSLKSVSIKHAAGMESELDFTPLYQLPHLERLSIAAPNMGLSKGPAIHIDFTKMHALRHVAVCTNERFNYPQVPTLETLWISNDKQHKDMSSLSCSPTLKQVDMLQCRMKSLNGIGKYPLQSFSISYLRSMDDISALAECAQTLRMLAIDTCGKIKDFTCLKELKNLEHLCLIGNNTLPSLDFLKEMPKLKSFVFSMNVEDGDLTPCLDIPYASCNKMKKHYNLKEKDLPKHNDGVPFTLR